MVKTLGLWVDEMFLAKTTYYSYYDIPKLGAEYARMALRSAVKKTIRNIYTEAGLREEFFSSGMSVRVHQHFEDLICLGSYTSEAYTQIVFIGEKGIGAKDIAFLVGDTIMSRLNGSQGLKLQFADLMFDLSHRKGDPTVSPKVYGTGDYSLTIIRLLDK